jgi:hypothetical protein
MARAGGGLLAQFAFRQRSEIEHPDFNSGTGFAHISIPAWMNFLLFVQTVFDKGLVA